MTFIGIVIIKISEELHSHLFNRSLLQSHFLKLSPLES